MSVAPKERIMTENAPPKLADPSLFPISNPCGCATVYTLACLYYSALVVLGRL